MRLLCVGIACLLFAGPLSADERIELRVLYCGDPESTRATDFRSFLEQHFTKVTFGDARQLSESQAADHDVVILDWSDVFSARLDPEKSRWMREAPLDENYSRPTVLIGDYGGMAVRKLKLKTDCLCVCLDGPAHHLALDHQVFHKPLEVNPEFSEMPTREGYGNLTIDPKLGETMQVWHVQTKNYPEVDAGLVSNLYGFTDSPDAEVFAQGIAMKGPDTVALSRHANYFLWGFSAQPSDMTPSGQRLFVNVISYIKKFDGQRPLVRVESSSREWALRFALMPKLLSRTESERERDTQKMRDEVGKLVGKNPEIIPKEYGGDANAFIAFLIESQKKSEASAMERLLPEKLRQEFGMDAEKYLAYYRENLEFLRMGNPESQIYVVDEDVKTLGISNRKVELLEKCVSLLENQTQAELALRVLKRYSQEDFDSAEKWRDWLEKNRDRLFFSDVGGYKFFVDTTASAR